MLAGATFEYDLERPLDAREAEGALRPLLAAMHAPAARSAVLRVEAGVRALPPRSHLGYVPIAGRVRAREWILSGLGSRGLIHHAMLGRAVAAAVMSGDESHIPEHCRRLPLSWRARAAST